MEKYLTIKDVMKIFKVSHQTIYTWIKLGLLKSSLVGGSRRFREKDIEDFFVAGSPTEHESEKKKADKTATR